MGILNLISEYGQLINLTLLIAIIGWLFALTQLYKEAIKEKYESKLSSTSERLKICNDQLNAQKYISSQQLELSDRHILDLRNKLSNLLEEEGITKKRLLMNIDTTSITSEIKSAIGELLKEITTTINKTQAAGSTKINDPNLYLEIAQGYSSSSQWIKAAENYDKYVDLAEKDWEAHFLRGVAYANARQGKVTDTAALRAYNEAVAFMPADSDMVMRARIFAYRGGIARRLRRLDEAEADLLLAQKYATADYEVYDIKYNLAAVYSIKGERSKFFETINDFIGRPEWQRVLNHLDDDFAEFSKDGEFIQLIAGNSEWFPPYSQLES